MSSSQIPGSTSVLVSRMQLVGRRNEMNLSAIPTVTQVNNTVTFEVPFAFYAGNAKMPAGSYTVTQPDDNAELLLKPHLGEGPNFHANSGFKSRTKRSQSCSRRETFALGQERPIG